MKTRQNPESGFLMAAALTSVFAACQREEIAYRDEHDSRHVAQAWIAEVIPPHTIVSGQDATFKVIFWKPDPCHEFKDYSVNFSDVDAELKVWLHTGEDPCITVVSKDEAELNVTFPYPGLYYLRFQGLSGDSLLIVRVN